MVCEFALSQCRAGGQNSLGPLDFDGYGLSEVSQLPSKATVRVLFAVNGKKQTTTVSTTKTFKILDEYVQSLEVSQSVVLEQIDVEPF